ncbi:MAG: multidrug effflux MFS transporter [Pseudomonadota bacterium]
MASDSPKASYIALLAMLMAIGALGTDIMLPALDQIGMELGVGAANDVHYLVTAFFLGMAGGQLLVGPLSDSFGRKPVIYAGYVIFVVGCIISMTTQSWTAMLAARVLQGIGAAAPRIVTVALVRDRFEGRAMARIMSFVMAAFIVVPIIAPALGEALILVGGWRAVFGGLAVLAMAVSVWFAVGQDETLAPENRRRFEIRGIFLGVVEIVRNRIAFGYTVAAGLMYGVFVGYLGSAQQIFEITFEVGTLFAAYFAFASLSLGLSSLLNAALVMRFGMERLTMIALVLLTVASAVFWIFLGASGGSVGLPLFLVWQLSAFFCVGVVFGNLNALALQDLGHMAGLGAAFVGAIATFISLPLASAIGARFDGTVVPLVAGFTILGLASCLTVAWTERGKM